MKRSVKFALLCVFSFMVILGYGCSRNHSQACLTEDFSYMNNSEFIKVHKEFHKKMLSEQSQYTINYFRNE